jgi:hypothetical protein
MPVLHQIRRRLTPPATPHPRQLASQTKKQSGCPFVCLKFSPVIPAKAGIQVFGARLDPGLRRDDGDDGDFAVDNFQRFRLEMACG